MGNIKTKKRNHLSIGKTWDCALIKGELRRHQAKEGTARRHYKRQFGNKAVAPLEIDPTGGRLDEEELLQEIENVTESEDSDKATENGNSPESIFEPMAGNPNQKSTSRVLQVAQQLIQAVDGDSNESDFGEELEELVVSLMAPLTGTPKVSR